MAGLVLSWLVMAICLAAGKRGSGVLGFAPLTGFRPSITHDLPCTTTRKVGEFPLAPWVTTRLDTARPMVPMGTSVLVPPISVWTSLLPPALLGLWKFEYSVSYAYGLSVGATALATMAGIGTSPTTLLAAHASILALYGSRLCIFLAWRNITSKRIQEMQQRIEKRVQERRPSLFSQLSYSVTCGLLYYCLSAVPVGLHAKATSLLQASSSIPALVSKWVPTFLLTVMASALTMGAYGDIYKSLKKKQLGESQLITTGIFRFLRHPNYTGETIAWTSQMLLGVWALGLWVWDTVSASTSLPLVLVAKMVSSAAGLLLGWSGMAFLLTRATTNLEAKQKKEYWRFDEYQQWMKSSWGGWTLPPPSRSKTESHEITPQAEVAEEGGSGI